MELKNLHQIETATIANRTEMLRFGVALLFIVGVMIYAGIFAGNVPGNYMFVAAAAIGAVFGVGFLREAIKTNYAEVMKEIKLHHADNDAEEVKAYLEKFDAASFDEKGVMLGELKRHRPGVITFSKAERKTLRREYREELVKRSAVIKIASAWVITVPVSGLLAAVPYFMFRGMLLP